MKTKKRKTKAHRLQLTCRLFFFSDLSTWLRKWSDEKHVQKNIEDMIFDRHVIPSLSSISNNEIWSKEEKNWRTYLWIISPISICVCVWGEFRQIDRSRFSLMVVEWKEKFKWLDEGKETRLFITMFYNFTHRWNEIPISPRNERRNKRTSRSIDRTKKTDKKNTFVLHILSSPRRRRRKREM